PRLLNSLALQLRLGVTSAQLRNHQQSVHHVRRVMAVHLLRFRRDDGHASVEDTEAEARAGPRMFAAESVQVLNYEERTLRHFPLFDHAEELGQGILVEVVLVPLEGGSAPVLKPDAGIQGDTIPLAPCLRRGLLPPDAIALGLLRVTEPQVAVTDG